MFIALVLSCSCHYSGYGILAMNSAAVFAEAGSLFSPIQSSILIAIVQFMAGTLNMFLIDRCGRRFLLIASCAGGAIGMTILSIHHFLKEQLPHTNWIPVVCVIFSIFFLTCGIAIVPGIVAIDILPSKVFLNLSIWFKCNLNKQ